MSVSQFMKLNDKLLNDFLDKNGFPKKYDAIKVKDLVSLKEISPLDLKLFLEDANTVMFDTPIIGAEVFRSDDAGKTWVKKNTYYLDRLYNTYGYYFGRIHVSPVNKDHVYVYGVPIIKSTDGGITYKSIDYQNVHVDHHDLWINPNNPDHLINGNDGGINMSYDGGENWTKLKVDKRKINTWIKELESADFIKKKGPKTFFVNPTNYWGGLATERSKAIRDYNSVILSL